MSEKMLLTQALDERDSLKEEIRKLIENTSSCFVDVIRENDKKTYKKELEEGQKIPHTLLPLKWRNNVQSGCFSRMVPESQPVP